MIPLFVMLSSQLHVRYHYHHYYCDHYYQYHVIISCGSNQLAFRAIVDKTHTPYTYIEVSMGVTGA